MRSSKHRRRAAALVPALSAALSIASTTHAQQPAEQVAQLRETTVTATRFAEPARSLPLGVSVITADEIRSAGVTTVTEALMRLAGVPGRQDFYGGGEYNLDLRGFGTSADNNQVVIVDGMRVSEADLGGTRLAGIPIESIERIEVLRGSGAVLYGEGATGGVIVITTRAGAGRQRASGASGYLAGGSYGLREARANATLNAGQGFTLDAHAQHRRADNHRDNFASRLQAGSLQGQWSGDWLRLGAGLAEDDLDTRLPGGISEAQFRADPKQTNTPGDWARLRNTRATLFAQAELGPWQIAADAGNRRRTLRSVNNGFPYDYDIDADTYALRARHEGELGGVNNVLVFGFDAGDWRRELLGLFGATATQRSRAFYAKDDVVLASGTRLAAGWRTERVRKANTSSGTGFSDRQHAWELGASHPLGGGVTAYARAGRSFRLANVDEFNYTSPGVMLQPQTSRDAEVGARWLHAAGEVEARLYRSELTDEIGFDPNASGPFGFPGANVNFDPTRRQGLELDAAHKLSATLGVRVNAAIRRATFREGPYAGRDVPLVPRRTLALRADWTPAAGHRVSGGVNWVSSQKVDYANACSVPSYSTADLRYAYAWRHAELSVGVSNLFDRMFYTQAFGCAGGAAAAVYPEPGRAFKLALRAWF